MGTEGKTLEKTLMTVMKTGRVIIGSKEVTRSTKGCKLVVYSTSLCERVVTALQETCSSASIPLVAYGQDSVRLGRLCKKPFKVSVLGIRISGEADLSPFLNLHTA